MAAARVYEVMFIVDAGTADDEVTRLTDNFRQIITDQGGTVTKSEAMGRRQLAYPINHKNEGIYVLFEIEGTGREIAELERRMRVSDQVVRYITVRMDEDRQRAEKFKARRSRRAGRRPFSGTSGGGRRGAGAVVAQAVDSGAAEDNEA